MPSRYRYNRYRDVEIDLGYLRTDVSIDSKEFISSIVDEYSRWAHRLDHSRDRFTAVMWLSLPKTHVKYLQYLVEEPLCFSLHHANNKRIMLVKTHPDSRGRTEVPSYGTHYVKVECVVVEDGSQRILMVIDRISATRTHSALKLVSGSSETGEFVADAAIREVFEETGIHARFGSLIGCGNRLRTRFDRDEIIMGCLLHAEPGQIPRADGCEVSVARWYDVHEAAERCTNMSREWIAAAHASLPNYAERCHTTDLYRGNPHSMDFFVPRLPYI